MVLRWVFGGFGFHATTKGADLIYKLGYLIAAALFCTICPVCPVHPDIILILWISMFRGHYPRFVETSIFCGYYLHVVDIVDIILFRGYYLYWSHYEILSS